MSFHSSTNYLSSNHYQDQELKNISCITYACGVNKLVTGHADGAIKLWKVTESTGGSLNILQDQIKFNIVDSASTVKFLLDMTQHGGDTFLAVYEKEKTIWNINSGICECILSNSSVYRYESGVALKNGLIVIAGHCSEAYECFDVLDRKTGQVLFEEENRVHRGWGIDVAITTNDYVIVHGYCGYEVCIWKVTHDECTLITTHGNNRIYSMTALPNGEIVTGGHSINLFSVSNDIIKFDGTIDNTNVIDVIIPCGGYNILTVDRQYANSGCIKFRNCLLDTYEDIATSFNASSHAVIPSINTIIAVDAGKLWTCKSRVNFNYVPKEYAIVRKYSRILAQGSRSSLSPISKLPDEIGIKIVSLLVGIASAEKIAMHHYRKG